MAKTKESLGGEKKLKSRVWANVDRDLHKWLKHSAIDRDCDMDDMVEEALVQYRDREERKSHKEAACT